MRPFFECRRSPISADIITVKGVYLVKTCGQYIFSAISHTNVGFGINCDMFWDETLAKLKTDAALMPFTVTVLGNTGVAAAGVKRVLSASADEVKMSVKGCVLTVRGEKLVIAEMGGGDILVRGRVTGVGFE